MTMTLVNSLFSLSALVINLYILVAQSLSDSSTDFTAEHVFTKGIEGPAS